MFNFFMICLCIFITHLFIRLLVPYNCSNCCLYIHVDLSEMNITHYIINVIIMALV